ncbi:MAG: helix-turn-helix domain-containing protein [Oscillospiraceae bacterium]|jgi:transcriptional regulator with XRE-family HTH domain|nr:helix-turn-helix domain-containing protein [Oscillospiraceae bacterium]
MLNDFGDIICAFRKKKGLSQRNFAALLGKRGVRVTNQAVSKWESGSSLPNAIQFLIICDLLDIVDISGVFIGRSFDFLNGLDEAGKKLTVEYAGMLRDSGRYDDPALEPPRGTKIRTLPVYDLAEADGKGRLLDLPDYAPTRVGNEVPLSANFGVRIYGDSMAPDYHSGQIVWIRQQAKLEHGETGVFIYEGTGYFKRLRDRVGGTRLQSIDANYPDIVVSNPETMVTLGKVAD